MHIYISIKKHATFLLIMASMQFSIFAQQASVYNAADVLNRGVLLHDMRLYDQAIQAYDSIVINDSSYFGAKLEKALSLMAQSRYGEVIRICNALLDDSIGEHPNLYAHLGSALDELGRYEEALKIFDRGISLFPMNYNLHFNKAVTLRRAGKKEEAAWSFQDAIYRFPFHGTSHLHLAELCFEEGRYTQSLMSYCMFLMTSAPDSLKLRKLSEVNILFGQANNPAPQGITALESAGFEKTDRIISNLIALDRKYRLRVKTDLPFTRQVQAMMENLPGTLSGNDIWSVVYARFFRGIVQAGLEEGCIYLLLSSATNEEIVKLVKKNRKKINVFAEAASESWPRLFDQVPLRSEGTVRLLDADRSDNIIRALGHRDEHGNRSGAWQEYDANGILINEGNLDNEGRREGIWNYYHDNGRISETGTLSEGLIEGTVRAYDREGYLVKLTAYKHNLKEGPETEYFPSGDTLSVFNYRNGRLEGPAIMYHNNREKHMELHYTDDTLEGRITKYYDDGKPEMEATYHKGLPDGPRKMFYRDGTLKSDEKLINGLTEGVYTELYRNGRIKSESTYKAGIICGISRNYYRNGFLSYEAEYNEKGEPHGEAGFYDRAGKKTYSLRFENGLAVSYRTFDKDGNVIKEAAEPDGILDLSVDYPDGGRMTEGRFIKGKREGMWRNYKPGGIPDFEEAYFDGQPSGEQRFFYPNGTTNRCYLIQNGVNHGPYMEYYSFDSMLYCRGHFHDGEPAGQWIYYTPEGKPAIINYFLDGKVHGYQFLFDLTGMLSKKSLYDRDMLKKEIHYDSLGKVQETIELKGYSGSVALHYPDGSLRQQYHLMNGYPDGVTTSWDAAGRIFTKGSFFNGNNHGEWIWYFRNGLPEVRGRYEYDNKEGEWIEYDYHGNKVMSNTYSEGLENGIFSTFYEDGRPRLKGMVEEFKNEGDFTYYSPGGAVMLVIRYRQGTALSYAYEGRTGALLPDIPLNPSGKVEAYYADGKPSVTGNFERGMKAGTWTFYYPNGNVQAVYHYVEGGFHGINTEYYADGIKKSELPYRKNALHGMKKVFLPDGSIDYQVPYVFGVAHGMASFYKAGGRLECNSLYYQGIIIEEKQP